LNYAWPGNVRELQHAVEKAVILADKTILDEDSFSLERNTKFSKGSYPVKTLDEMEKEMIKACLRNEKGNMSAVAKKLGITRQTLYNKMKRYGI
jgi:DNA-binding NtrC family response regulator